jgi:hypothetical protein
MKIDRRASRAMNVLVSRGLIRWVFVWRSSGMSANWAFPARQCYEALRCGW